MSTIVVSEAFVKHAALLAGEVKNLTTKVAEMKKQSSAPKPLDSTVALVADTLVNLGFVPAKEKQAAASALCNHESTLHALSKIASQVAIKTAAARNTPAEVQPMGKSASVAKPTGARESDRQFLNSLGFTV